MTEEEYQEIYCTYCDSQRCFIAEGLTLSEVCPYWKVRQNNEDVCNVEIEFWHIVPINDGYTYLCVDEYNNYFLERKENEAADSRKLKFISEADSQLYIDKKLDNSIYKPEKYWVFAHN